MKIKILLVVFFCTMLSNAYSQTFQWHLLNNSPGQTGSGRFEDMFFTDENNGWIISFGGQAFSTTNAGVTWTSSFTVANSFFRSVGFFNTETGIIGTLTNDSNKILYRTTNSGLNWSTVSLPSPRIKGICGISIVNENYAYACGRYFAPARVIKTTNSGLNWMNINPDSSMTKSLIDCYFWSVDSGIVVGGYNTTGNFENGVAVVLMTTNGGTSWRQVHKTTRTGEWCWKISFISRSIGFVSIERESGFAYFLKTTNGGLNWTEFPFREYDEEGIGFINENTGWIGGWTGPTYQTTNGGANWQLAGWGTNVNRFRIFNDTLAYAVGDRVYKYSSGPVGVEPVSAEIPDSYKLFQNYPNPFNPLTVISYTIGASQLTVSSDVELKVYDALGKEVALLVNERQSAGKYDYKFDGSNLSSGIYFYVLSADAFTEIKRMILLK